MQSFKFGSDVVLTVSFIDENGGNPVTPTAASYAVFDSNGEQIVPTTSVADTSGTDAQITIPANKHVAPGGYALVLTMTVGADTVENSVIYLVVPAQRLQILKNTFVTIQQAMFIASTTPGLQSWTGAGSDDQVASMAEAFSRLTRLNYVIPWPELVDMQSRIAPYYKSEITPRMWPLMTPDLYAAYPEQFRNAIAKAQVIEANAVIVEPTDGYAARRRAGLMSESIGESSIMFRAGTRPLETPVSTDTLKCLTGFLNNRITLTRS